MHARHRASAWTFAITALLLASSAGGLVAQEPEPVGLADLDAAPLLRRSEVVPWVRFEDWASPVGRRASIELPEPFRLRPDDGLGSSAVIYEIGFGSPRFYIAYAHPDDAPGHDAPATEPDFGIVDETGEREGLRWFSRLRTMHPRVYRERREWSRPLPPGERRWMELGVVTRVVGPDGIPVRCSADIAPLSRARHGSPTAARDWLIERCATVRLE